MQKFWPELLNCKHCGTAGPLKRTETIFDLMEWFEDESDKNLLLFLQFTQPFAAVLLSNLILHLWKIKHSALQPVVMGKRENIPWAASLSLILKWETRTALQTCSCALPSGSSRNACCPQLLSNLEMHNIYFLKTVAHEPMMAILHCANIWKMLCIIQLCLEALPATATGCVQTRVTGAKRTPAMSFLNKSFIFCLILQSVTRSKSLVDSGDQVCRSIFLPWLCWNLSPQWMASWCG